MSSPNEVPENPSSSLWTQCKTFVAQAIPDAFRDDPYYNLMRSLANFLFIAIQNENINGVKITFKRLMDHAKGRDDEWVIGLLERVARALSVKALELKPALTFTNLSSSVNVSNVGPDDMKQQFYNMANTVGDFIYLAHMSNMSDDDVVAEPATPGMS